MNDVFTRIYELLEKQGIPAGRMCKEIGINPSTFYVGRNNNSTPRAENLAKIAEYLGTTTEYLLTGSAPVSDEEGYYYDPAVAKMAEELKENTGMRILLDASRDLKMEELLEVIDFVNSMKKED